MTNLWHRLRNLDRLSAMEERLRDLVGENRLYTGEIKELQTALDSTRTRAIAAETLSSERRAECDRLSAELTRAHDDVTRLMVERLKSLDTLNLKLMEPRAEAPAPDMSQFKAVERMAAQGIRRIRQIHNDVDMALLGKLHPNFKRGPQGPVMNAPQPVESPVEEPKGAA